jgi:hypothetical protein
MSYDKVATNEQIAATQAALSAKNYHAEVVENSAEALRKILEIIPAGASVISGASETLGSIGFRDLLKSGKHSWDNLQERILAEKDSDKQAKLRKQASMADFYLGSVHALTQQGEMIIASNTGSQLPGIVFNASNLIFVVGAQKIATDLADGLNRLEKHVVPLEDVRMKGEYGVGTNVSKILIFKDENAMYGRQVHVIIVKESLGF